MLFPIISISLKAGLKPSRLVRNETQMYYIIGYTYRPTSQINFCIYSYRWLYAYCTSIMDELVYTIRYSRPEILLLYIQRRLDTTILLDVWAVFLCPSPYSRSREKLDHQHPVLRGKEEEEDERESVRCVCV